MRTRSSIVAVAAMIIYLRDHYLLLELLPPGDGPEEDDGPVLQDQLRIGSLPQVRVGRALTEVVGGSLQHSLLPALSAVRAAELVLLISSLHRCPGVQQQCVPQEFHSGLQQRLFKHIGLDKSTVPFSDFLTLV